MTQLQLERKLFDANEQLDYLIAMSFKRCNPETIKKIDGFIKQVTAEIDELEQQITN